ncbi:PTS system EIIC permease component [Leminorella grimontii]|uniref:PTS system EIIC permease component n=1 Tax=Leminorella grimontii TaxID=82981 RepID=A0AAV5N0F2_9GAMM|nr:PTS sugar transporter subunit IIC SgcC [Leminorella grimontii]KFC97433.1 PTS system galactitol-specific IIC component [Leminorella grimontii ATCC 33999 = DSM 5078]GKX55207.1 PTS system EIIC permease component [Leminorella grimontii]GKX58631.1 PTS system EIIC permease component [Leminorella grimontii]VFS56765.1 PTS system galactitol-specific EIIC component [Leminorella grimontii]
MFDYILSLGGTIFVPIVMIVIGLIFRIPLLQAIKAGVTVGIGFVGMGLVIVMAIDSLSPPIKVMIERFGLTLHVLDVGAGPASGVGYATAIGAMIIPVIFLLNVAMLVTRLTKTMNVDIYNYWHFAITGSIVQLMTGSLIYGVLGAICHAALSLKMADLTAKRVQSIVGLDGISIPQGYGSSSVPLFILLDKLYGYIPFLKGRNVDATEIQKRFGMIGDPVIIGVVLGLVFGLAAGENFKGTAGLMITVAAIMVLFPRMIRLIVEGLMPISDGARKFFQRYLHGREVFIGLDSAVTLGHPTTIAVGLLLIPIMLLIASILPGNKVLPLADLPVAPFFICMATVIHRGDLLRTLVSGIIVMITVLLIATRFAPYFTEMARSGGFSFAADGASISALSVGNMFGWSITELMALGAIGVVIAVGIVCLVVLGLRNKELSA